MLDFSEMNLKRIFECNLRDGLFHRCIEFRLPHGPRFSHLLLKRALAPFQNSQTKKKDGRCCNCPGLLNVKGPFGWPLAP